MEKDNNNNNEATFIQLDLFGNAETSWAVERKKNANKKHEAIRAEYRRISKILHDGKYGLKHEDIIKELAEKFFMSPVTIEKIL